MFICSCCPLLFPDLEPQRKRRKVIKKHKYLLELSSK